MVRVTPVRRPPHTPTCEGHSPEDTAVLSPTEREALQASYTDSPEAPLCCGGDGRILGVPLQHLANVTGMKRGTLSKRAKRRGFDLPRLGGSGRPQLVPIDMIHILCKELPSSFLAAVSSEAGSCWRSIDDLMRLAAFQGPLVNESCTCLGPLFVYSVGRT